MMEFAKKMNEDLILKGMGERTRETYIRAVLKLEEYTQKTLIKAAKTIFETIFFTLSIQKNSPQVPSKSLSTGFDFTIPLLCKSNGAFSI